MFGWSDFGGEKVEGPGCFLSRPTIFQPLQIGEKIGKIIDWMEITHLPLPSKLNSR